MSGPMWDLRFSWLMGTSKYVILVCGFLCFKGLLCLLLQEASNQNFQVNVHQSSLKNFTITCITQHLPGRSSKAIWAALASSILIPSLAPGARSATVPDTLLAADSICADIMFTWTNNRDVFIEDLHNVDVYTLLERQYTYCNKCLSDIIQINVYIHHYI